MKYLLIHALPPSLELSEAQAAEAGALFESWLEEMISRGVSLHGSRLRPVSDATTVRVRDEQLLVADGPFAETKEQVAGYDMIECADLKEALDVASRHPTARLGSIEVRPLWQQ